MEDFDNLKSRKFKGAKYFRLRIAYSLLTLTPIEIDEIRTDLINIGISSFEVSFLKFIELISNGTKIFISSTGTLLRFIPGTITNNYGKEFSFEFDKARCLSYYIEGILPICLYGKEKLICKLNGVSNNNEDLSMDCFKANIDSLLDKIVVGDTFSFDISKRSFYPDTSAEVKVIIPIIRFIEPLDLRDSGKVAKVRGHYLSVNSNMLHNGIIDQARVIFNRILNDVWIDKNTQNGKDQTPGFGLSLWGITTTNTVYSYDFSSFGNSERVDPEELINKVASKMLTEVYEVSI